MTNRGPPRSNRMYGRRSPSSSHLFYNLERLALLACLANVGLVSVARSQRAVDARAFALSAVHGCGW